MRFGNAFDNGINYHQMSVYFYGNFKQFGYFSLHYIPYNFNIEVFRFPSLSSHFPFINDQKEGFGFLWDSPVFLLLIPALFLFFRDLFRQKKNLRVSPVESQKNILFAASSLISAVLISLVVFSIMGTGWMQFASRYSLDYQFFMIIFLLIVLKDYIARKSFYFVFIPLLILSLYVNYAGVKVFYQI